MKKIKSKEKDNAFTTFEVKKLHEILKKVIQGASSKNMTESMSYFFFSGTDVITYNSKISIQHPLKTKFSFFVKAKSFYDIVSKVKTKDIRLGLVKGKLVIQSKQIKASLTTIMDEEVVTRINEVRKSLKKIESWKALPKNFSECINLCSFASVKEEEELTLSCISLEKTKCIASDNQRIALAKLTGPIDGMLLQSSEVSKLNSTEPTFYAVTKSWLHFKNDEGCIFSIRRVLGEFPDFESLMHFDGTIVELPRNITEGIDLTNIFISEEQKAITISISPGNCIVSIKTEEGTMKYRTDIVYDGKKLQFTINPTFLKEMLNYSTIVTIAKERIKLETENFSTVTALFSEEG